MTYILIIYIYYIYIIYIYIIFLFILFSRSPFFSFFNFQKLSSVICKGLEVLMNVISRINHYSYLHGLKDIVIYCVFCNGAQDERRFLRGFAQNDRHSEKNFLSLCLRVFVFVN